MEIKMYPFEVKKDDNGDVVIIGEYEPEYGVTDTIIISQYQIDILIKALTEMKDK